MQFNNLPIGVQQNFKEKWGNYEPELIGCGISFHDTGRYIYYGNNRF